MAKQKKNPNEEKTTATPDDALFKKMMAVPEIAKDVLQTGLPQQLVADISFDNFKSHPTNFITDHLTNTFVDMLFEVEIKGREGYVYCLVEHMRTNRNNTGLRILKYTCDIIQHHLDTHPGEKTWPIVLPLLCTNADGGFKGHTNILDNFGDFKDFSEKYMFQEFSLIDFNKIGDETTREHAWGSVMMLPMKLARERQVFEKLEESNYFQLIEVLFSGNFEPLLGGIIKYILRVNDYIDPEEFCIAFSNKDPRLEGVAMNAYDKLIDKGARQNSLEIAKNMLLKNMDAGDIADITKLPLAEVEKLGIKKSA